MASRSVNLFKNLEKSSDQNIMGALWFGAQTPVIPRQRIWQDSLPVLFWAKKLLRKSRKSGNRSLVNLC